MKRWITFDLDGTLMQNPFGKAVFPEIETLIREHGHPPELARKAFFAEHEARMAANRTVDAYDWDDIVGACLKRQQIPLTVDIEALVRKHSHPPHIYLLEEGIPRVLERLASRGFSLAVVTNGFYKYQYPVMEALGLAAHFERIVTPERAGCGKPDIRIMDGLRREGEVVAHVGDRVDHDVCLANEVGAASVLICRELPGELKHQHPRERAKEPSLTPVFREKWQAETKTAPPADFAPRCMPDIVIRSLDELLLCV